MIKEEFAALVFKTSDLEIKIQGNVEVECKNDQNDINDPDCYIFRLTIQKN